MLRLLALALCASLFLESGTCFTSAPSVARGVKTSALSMSNNPNNDVDRERKVAASVLTAAYLFANVISTAPVLAATQEDFFGSSSQVVAAKSGGRMGGRSSSSSMRSSSSYSRPSTVNTRTSHTTIIQQPVYASPPVYGGGYGYGYGGGVDAGTLGVVVGINAISGISREMREQSQERQIQQERSELSEARMRQAELEGRIRAMEAAQYSR